MVLVSAAGFQSQSTLSPAVHDDCRTACSQCDDHLPATSRLQSPASRIHTRTPVLDMAVQVSGTGKVFPYSFPSVGPGSDPGVQAVSPQVTLGHPPGGRLPLLSSRPAVTFPIMQIWSILDEAASRGPSASADKVV